MDSHNQSKKGNVQALPRKKLYSLRFLNPKYHNTESARHDPEVFKKLQQSLAKDNKEQQPLAEPSPVFPDEEKEVGCEPFWQQFMEEASKFKDKVQSEKVNCYEKQYNRLKRQVEKQSKVCQLQLQRLQNAIKDKYKQIHSFYEQIKLEKADITIRNPLEKAKQGRKSQPLLINQNNPKITVLKQSIESIRKEVEGLESQINSLKNRKAKIQKQWQSFLSKMLKEGFYLRRGVIPILQQMVSIKYVPSISDLPYCLDDVSKRCLLLQYQQIRSNTQKKADSEPLTTRVSSEPKSLIIGITDKQLTREIYKETKQMMSSLIKETAAKKKLTLPPILPLKTNNQCPARSDWRANQRRRLSHVYEGQKYNLSKSILFGPKVQFL